MQYQRRRLYVSRILQRGSIPILIKVIEQRPLAGLAHAFVYWGFLAFAPITTNHIATAFGARFLFGESGFGGFYFGFVAVWAVALFGDTVEWGGEVLKIDREGRILRK